VCTVRIWQANIGKTIVAHVPITHGQVQETGDFELDGVAFPAAEVALEFMPRPARMGPCSPPARGGQLDVPGVGSFQATLINAGIPTIFLNAKTWATPAPSCSAPSTATRSAGALRGHPRLGALRWA
jgi:2-methylaconitate cis-trans-isomerase PrpF